MVRPYIAVSIGVSRYIYPCSPWGGGFFGGFFLGGGLFLGMSFAYI